MAIDLDVSGAAPFFYILIGGIGIKEGTEAKQLYTFTRVPDWAPTATQKFISGLHIPGEWSQSTDLWGGVSSGQSLTVEIQDSPQANGTYRWAELFALGRWTQDAASYPQTYVTQTLRPHDKVMHVQTTAAFPAPLTSSNADRTVFVGLETMRYEARRSVIDPRLVVGVGATEDTFRNLTRNLFPAVGEVALEHAVQNLGEARQPVVTTVPRNLFGRLFGLYCGLQYPDGSWSPEADSIRLFAGSILTAEWVSDKSLWRLTCDDMLALLDQQCCTALTRTRNPADQDGTTSVVASSKLSGISLAPHVLGSTDQGATDNRIQFRARRVSTGVLTHNATLVLGEYTHLSNLWWADISNFLSSQTDALLFVTVDGYVGGGWRIGVLPSVDYQVRLICGKAVAFMLGLTDGSAEYNSLLYVSADEQGGWEPGEGGSAEVGMWLRSDVHGAAINVKDRTWFWEKADQGDGRAPAVRIGDALLARYSGTSGLPANAGTLNPNPSLSSTFRGQLTNVTNVFGVNYGPNRWPEKGGGAAQRGNEEGPDVVQVMAPNATVPIMTTILRLMMSTGYGTYAIGDVIESDIYETVTTPLNGPYDVYPPGAGAGIPAALVDAQSFIDSQAQFDSALLLRGDVFQEAFPIRDLINREGQLLGFTVSIVNGRITARVVPSLATAVDPVATLDESNRSSETDHTSSVLSTKNIINAVNLQFGYHLQSKKFTRFLNLNFPISQQENRVRRAQAVENKGLNGDAQTLGDHLKPHLTLRQTLYGWPLWTLRRSYVYRLWTVLAPGQIVAITDGRSPDAGVPDPFVGTLGLVSRYAAVTSCSYNYKGGSGQVELVLLTMQSNVLPVARVLDVQWNRGDGGWDGATSRLYVAANTYTTAPDNDLTGTLVGMVVRVTDTSSATPDTPPETLVTVTAVNIDAGGDAANYIELAGQDLNALLPGGFVATHRYTVVEDPYGEGTELDTVFYFRDALASGSNFGRMTRDDSSGIAIATTGTGWTVGTATPIKGRAVQYGAEVAGFSSPVVIPVPDNATANAWRSAVPMTATFPAGLWTLSTWVRAVTAGSTMDGAMLARFFRGTSPTGVGAVEISGGADLTGSTVINLTTTRQLSSLTASLPAITFSGEYLFVVLVWTILGAGSGGTDDCLIEIGNPNGTWTSLRAPLLSSTSTPIDRAYMADADTSEIGTDVGHPYG